MRFRKACLFVLLFSSLITITNDHLFKKSIAMGGALILGTSSQMAYLSSRASTLFPETQPFAKEFLLLGQLCGNAAHDLFKQGFKKANSLASWERNQKVLSEIPAVSSDLSKLLLFLERRWLSKANGFYEAEIDWICPSYGYSMQVHPITTNCYARDPATKASQTYLERVEAWKEILPHPKNFPLILTRPANIAKYLPPSVVDLTANFSDNKEEWPATWERLRKELSKREDAKTAIFIQRVQEGEVGGIRLLPVTGEGLEAKNHFLLEWMACFGLSANPVELDRFFPNAPLENSISAKTESLSKESILLQLNSFVKDWTSEKFEKTLMVKGVVKTAICLLDSISDEKWEEVQSCPTRSAVVKAAFSQITQELELLKEQASHQPFFHVATRVEEIHANLSSLIEIFSPFGFDDLLPIYQKCLTGMPNRMKQLAFCTVHSAAMTTVAGILEAANPKKILYGDNIYFECEKAFEFFGRSTRVEKASEKDWEEVDLLFAQYNPVLKRGKDFELNGYHVEDVEGMIRKSMRENKALTVALDCTIDYIDSAKFNHLLTTFEREIEKGLLSFICYRSGLKFDLFGMDNFAGAPLLMIHNHDPKWNAFNSLLTDPALKTDPLSLNWFCLAFKAATQELEQYRKLIFANTRALLNELPSRLTSSAAMRYRVIPMDPDADPGFIDVKVFGPFHEMRASALVTGTLYLKSMEGGHPIFWRRSFGFYHPNFGVIFDEEYTTVRLTLGLDSDQISLFKSCFEMIDRLND